MDNPQIEYTIQYAYGSYSGKERVILDADEIDWGIDPIQKMWERLRHDGHLSLSMATRSAKIIDSRVIA